MAVLRELRAKARQITPPVIGACLVAYFAYHAVQGERGLLAWLRLKQELAQANAAEASLAAGRAKLERRVGLLRPDHLDLDMLDERAHAVLNYGRNDEYVIFLPARPGAAE
ncbi:MAG: septum formation initiator family protein [Kiloniellaceae bacterium]